MYGNQWSTDGVVVARNGPSLVSYRFILKRSDDGKLFKCEAFDSEGESILESSVILEVFYIPKISFSPKQTLTVKENEQAQLICINDGNDQNATTIWKRQRTSTIVQNNCVLNFKNVKRTDAGLYTCIVDTKVGVYEDNARVIVLYAPTIDIEYFPSTKTMKCIPRGIPDSYMFKDWEHTTEYNDHLRFLATTKEGNNATLTIPQNVNKKDNNRERGIYICRASNNISSIDGTFAMQKYNLNLPGKPHFVSSTENTQYGIYLETTEIKIKFVSVPENTNYVVYKNGIKFTDYNESVLRNTKIIDTMYGKNVSVKGNILSLFVKLYTSEDFCWYKIAVKNVVGCSNYSIKLFSASLPGIPQILRAVPKQTEIAVLWNPGFHGGYHRWFIIEYRKVGDIYWSNQTTNSPNSTVIGGLQPVTIYLIRMFSRNRIHDSKRTEEILIQTGNVLMQ
ncbi:unnamed protein product [Mytilus coruscus]|uniref:NCAM n=1 Tax=Mytilus coruscus TaxID=42192 RepID=A0A6J8BZ81_MYTCO|nr:unnamed protein product [Mytilus coruscus]